MFITLARLVIKNPKTVAIALGVVAAGGGMFFAGKVVVDDLSTGPRSPLSLQLGEPETVFADAVGFNEVFSIPASDEGVARLGLLQLTPEQRRAIAMNVFEDEYDPEWDDEDVVRHIIRKVVSGMTVTEIVQARGGG